MALLRYSIADEMLYGTVNGQSLSLKAFSGGGRGSKNPDMVRNDVAHWDTNKKAPAGKVQKENRGGPIPPGWYTVEYLGEYDNGTVNYGRAARLNETITARLHRDLLTGTVVETARDMGSFLIHGRGKYGSDGCIVPATSDALHKLLDAVQKSKEPVALQVHSEGIRIDKVEGKRPVDNIA